MSQCVAGMLERVSALRECRPTGRSSRVLGLLGEVSLVEKADRIQEFACSRLAG